LSWSLKASRTAMKFGHVNPDIIAAFSKQLAADAAPSAVRYPGLQSVAAVLGIEVPESLKRTPRPRMTTREKFRARRAFRKQTALYRGMKWRAVDIRRMARQCYDPLIFNMIRTTPDSDAKEI